jgi:nitrous oxidase accessory protein NosD
MKKLFFLLPLLSLLVFQSCQKDDALAPGDLGLDERGKNCTNQITIPAGSVDALQQAINDVCVGGTITLAAGEHIENSMVTVNKRLTIKGQPGAVLKVASTTFPNLPTTALYVIGAQSVKLEGFELQPISGDGGLGILLHNAPHATVKDCTIRKHTISVTIEQSDFADIVGNTIEASTIWTENDNYVAHGVLVVNGKNAKVRNNEIYNALFGIWACDKNGLSQGNNTHHNFLGQILCKVPASSIPLPDGTFTGAAFSGTNWHMNNNVSTDNYYVGYLVIDGANGNTLVNNQGGNNATYDIDLKGENCVFGFVTPTSFNNHVVAGSHQVTIKDCGLNNTVIGGIQIDTAVDPCDPTECPE